MDDTGFEPVASSVSGKRSTAELIVQVRTGLSLPNQGGESSNHTTIDDSESAFYTLH